MKKDQPRGTHWPVHPIALLFPPKPPEERAELKLDILERVARGLDPLESPILLYQGQILDGRHRDELWVELGEEGACGGFFDRNLPPTDTYKPDKHGTLGAWLKAKSRNLVVRQTPADQRAAIFLRAAKAHPDLQAHLDQIEEENLRRKKEGQPLGAGVQRGNTAEQVADLAGVGATTVKQVQKLQKEAPEKFEEVFQGKTTAKKALKEVKGQKGAKGQKDQKVGGKGAKAQPASASFKPGDTIYRIEGYRPDVAGSPRLLKLTLKSVKKRALFVGAERVPTSEAFTLGAAKEERKSRIKGLIAALQEALKSEPAIVAGPPVKTPKTKKHGQRK
jgi:hypothetical protein